MSLQNLKVRGRRILESLRALYPAPKCGLDFHNSFELLVATVLSAQCTDVRVNMVTPSLFNSWPDPFSMSGASEEALQEKIRSLGFFRSKAVYLRKLSVELVSDFNGIVPMNIENLIQLPGVGRKTANVVINEFGEPQGIAVDTHVIRLSNRLGLTMHSDPIRIEIDLMELFQQNSWRDSSHLLISHGRRICKARKPLCSQCSILNQCPWFTSNGNG
ncbi:MAG: endonuclease III [Candidatus Wallbacteria bacterium HGW-Wallbacteria-1]|jgi:endonuclease-3|uniref:Endonuclease III n=1 Tax=Candidatus Wallbacteria bacterium HGW-Wallbacteria-1 TaxID=2013854 RepID=A0A2N1PRH2_9BACT|nr:MAG: endonuclease III [Candidatus Wallbacteria bacterium HGW-Wallbacteria-1]